MHILKQANFKIAACGATSQFAMGSASESVDLLILGIYDGIEAEDWTQTVCVARNRFSGLRTIILVERPAATFLHKAAEYKIDAVLSRNISAEVLRGAIELVLLGQQLFPPPNPTIARDFFDEPSADAATVHEIAVKGISMLSEREDQILRFLAAGLRNKLIAYDLGISEATVKFHIRALLRKIGATNRTQAAIWCMSNGVDAAKAPSGISVSDLCTLNPRAHLPIAIPVADNTNKASPTYSALTGE